MSVNSQAGLSPFEREHREHLRAMWAAAGLLVTAFGLGVCVGFIVAAVWVF